MAREIFRGRHLLIVEDEYMIAASLCVDLAMAGATIVGPVASTADALELVSSAARIDAAVLDLNLGGQIAFPVADALRARGIPFVFATGYDEAWLQTQYPKTPRCEKPYELATLAAAMAAALRHGAADETQVQRRTGSSGNPASRSPWA